MNRKWWISEKEKDVIARYSGAGSPESSSKDIWQVIVGKAAGWKYSNQCWLAVSFLVSIVQCWLTVMTYKAFCMTPTLFQNITSLLSYERLHQRVCCWRPSFVWCFFMLFSRPWIQIQTDCDKMTMLIMFHDSILCIFTQSSTYYSPMTKNSWTNGTTIPQYLLNQ